MAIDPKELRIGSHVECNDNRCVVVAIADLSSALRSGVALKVDSEVMLNADPNLIDPIPITPELLTELGFEKLDVHGNEVFRRLYKDTPLGKMYYVVNYNPNAEAWNFCVHPSATEVKYLHELESVAYLATKQELIND